MKYISCLILLCVISFSSVIAQNDQVALAKGSSDIYEKGIFDDLLIWNVSSINSETSDFSPMFYQNGLVYVTSRIKNGPVDPRTNERFTELYYSEYGFDDNLLPPIPFSPEINTLYNEGPVTFGNDGRTIYFTRNNYKNNMRQVDGQNNTNLKIYEAEKGPFDWVNIEELPFNDDAYNTCNPALTSDGKILYFTSDQPGTVGGMDLFFSIKNGTEWSAPVNLGSEINTAGNELYPFIYQDKYLFFASDGRHQDTGLDIYMVDVSANEKNIIRLEEPFNTEFDDLGLIISSDGKSGFFASNRAGGIGRDDIYAFRNPKGIPGLNTPKVVEQSFVVRNTQNTLPVKGAFVKIFTKQANGNFEAADGMYDVQIDEDSIAGVATLSLVRNANTKIVTPDLITDGNGKGSYVFRKDQVYLVQVQKEGFQPVEFVFDPKKTNNRSNYTINMTSVSCVTLAGSVKSDKFNQVISNAAITITSEACDFEEKLISNLDGEFYICLPYDCSYNIEASKEGYVLGRKKFKSKDGVYEDDVEISLYPVSNTPLEKNIVAKAPTMPIKSGSVIVLNNIYYDFNKSAIRTGDAKELDALALVMKQHPAMNIDLIAHTDCRGSKEFNLELSQRRAESAKYYLVSAGVDPGRIIAIGRGEEEPRNNCCNGVRCDDAGHAYNRRTEIRVRNGAENVRILYKE